MKIKISGFKEKEEEKIWVFKRIIKAFFDGAESFETTMGFVWIAKHGEKRIKRSELYKLELEMKEMGMEAPYIFKIDRDNPDFGYISEFETLTIEPKEGGQYEVAVRTWSEGKWRGYKIREFDPLKCFLVGVNTRGH